VLALAGVAQHLAPEGRGVQGYLAHKNRAPLGPYSRIMPRALWWPNVGGLFFVSEVTLWGSVFETFWVRAFMIRLRVFKIWGLVDWVGGVQGFTRRV
jgi:hypothetical protein